MQALIKGTGDGSDDKRGLMHPIISCSSLRRCPGKGRLLTVSIKTLDLFRYQLIHAVLEKSAIKQLLLLKYD